MRQKKPTMYKTAGLTAIVFAVFLLGSLLFVYTVRKSNEEMSVRMLADSTRQRSDVVKLQIESDLQVLRGVAVSLSEVNLSSEERVTAILNTINSGNTFVMMGLADTDGTVQMVDRTGPPHREDDLSRFPFFQKALTGEEVVSETFEYTRGVHVNFYAVPVYEEGQVVGVLCAANSESILQNILSVPVFQEQGYFGLFDSEGRLVAPNKDPNPSVHVGGSIFEIATLGPGVQEDLAAALHTETEGSFAISIGGAEQIATVRPLGVNGWSIISVVPFTSINAFINRTAVGIVLLMLAACVVFFYLVVRYIRADKKNRVELERLAYIDELTGVRNYTKFVKDAEAFFAGAPDKHLAFWSFDVKEFYRINDIFGREMGDKVLRCIAHRFLQAEKDEGGLCCRVGSDQFAGLRRYQNREEMSAWFFGIHTDLAAIHIFPSNRLQIDDTMGVFCIDEFENRPSVNEMLGRASIARKAAKQKGGTQISFFTSQMGKQMHRDAEIEAGGRLALENNEFLFFLQPKVAIQDGFHIRAAEALVRWHHPRLGWLAPGLFIPLFEDNGFVVELDRYVFEQVCNWLHEIRRSGLPEVRVAVNVSRQGMMCDDFIEYYAAVRDRYGLRDASLELEFTESIIMEDYGQFSEVVLALQKEGFTCSIDDFGSGYSSLNVLKNLPIDVLKLDAAFFRDSEDEGRERTVVAQFIQMAHELGIRTVAEGVETRRQVAFLQKAGCDMIQGYIFSRPVPPGEFEALLTKAETEIELRRDEEV